MELGLGIHGEPGVEKIDLPQTDKLCFMVDKVVELLASKMPLFSGMKKIVTVSNLGGFSSLEFANICQLVTNRISNISRFGSGCLMTSLDMRGFNVSVTEVQKSEQLAWFDSKHNIPAWPAYTEPSPQSPVKLSETATKSQLRLDEATAKMFKSVAEHLIRIESEVNELDRISADGDCGSTNT